MSPLQHMKGLFLPVASALDSFLVPIESIPSSVVPVEKVFEPNKRHLFLSLMVEPILANALISQTQQQS